LKYNYLERNAYHSIARMKYEHTNPIEFVDMGYNEEEEEATNTFEMHFIELPKFKQKNPECNTKLEQWLWLIDGSEEEKVEMSAKENEEINKTVEELNKLSKDPEEVAKYEEREWSIMRYNVEMKTNRELGEKEGEARGREEGRREGRREGEKTTKEKIVKALKNMNLSIEQIAQAVELTEKEVEKILKV
jgi:predicted transposase/invertase (TIGR01784 family)